jgi:hypothetical protein
MNFQPSRRVSSELLTRSLFRAFCELHHAAVPSMCPFLPSWLIHYSDHRIRMKCLFNVDYFLFNKLHISTVHKLFGMLCHYSNASEAKDVSDFADKLQLKPFFSQQNELTRSFQGTMLRAYQQLNSKELTLQANMTIVRNPLGHAF